LDTDLSGDLNNGLGVSVFSEGKWTVLTSDSLGGLSNISDLLRYDNNTLYASFGSGVYDAAKETIFNQANSLLGETDNTDMKVLVSGLVEDRDRKVWISAFGDYSLYCIDREDEWQRFDLGLSAAEEPYTLQINERNQLWMRLGLEGSKGILAYDIDDAESRLITTSDGLPSNQVNDIAFGKDGEIWIATAKGIVYFPFAFGIIEDNSVGVVKPVFEGAFLFEDKEVTAVAIDGGDRKWIGGKEGLWLFEDNIESEVAHFTTENSPLPSNTIVDISIDPLTGEVFVVTDNGVLSYRSDASEGLVKHQDVDIYPNPVRPNYSGLVGFAGLVDDGVLKITTVSGRLVREINANGGAASWDVADYNGRRVNTGVYLVYSSNSDGTETYVGKIAVVN
jgi:hypothetical protein